MVQGGVGGRCWCETAWRRLMSTCMRAEGIGRRRGGGDETELVIVSGGQREREVCGRVWPSSRTGCCWFECVVGSTAFYSRCLDERCAVGVGVVGRAEACIIDD